MAKLDLHVWYRQYQNLKEQNPDAILLYRLGDFYEVFDDDAKLVAELLDVTLTRKDYASEKTAKGTEKKYCPMAGMPYHAVESYVSRLVNQGYRVAIAEQLSETASSKSDTRPRSVYASGLEHTNRQRGIAHREVVRVITPGTVVDPSMLTATQNNYLAAVIADKGHIGMSYADLSTGEFAATELSGDRAAIHLQGELSRLQVSEILVPDDATLQLPGLTPSTARLEHDLAPMTKEEREMLPPHERVARRLEQENTAQWAHGHVTGMALWRWEHNTCRDTLMQQLGTHSLSGFGLEQKPLAMRAAGAILQYIKETQYGDVSQINAIRVYTTGTYMFLDPQTRRNLELLEGSSGKEKGALIGVLDQTRTPMGARLLRRWLSQPLLEIDALNQRHDAVECCVNNTMMHSELRQALKEIGDMERVVTRIIQGTSVATPRDLTQLRQALQALPSAIAAVGEHEALLLAAQDSEGIPQARHSPQCLHQTQPESYAPANDAPQATGVLHEKKAGYKAQSDKSAPRSTPAPRVQGDDLFDDEDEDASESAPLQDTPSAQTEPASLEEEQKSTKGKRTRKNASHKAKAEQSAPTDTPPTTSMASEIIALPPSPEKELPDAAVEELPDATVEEPPEPPKHHPTPTATHIDPCSEALELLQRAMDDDPPAVLGASNYLRDDEGPEKPRRVIRPGYDERIDEVVAASRDAQNYIDNLEHRERGRTGIKSLKVDYNKVFGYYIEVPRTYSNQVPKEYERKQTLVSAERYITGELKEYESVILNAQQRLVEYERDAFAKLCTMLCAEQSERLRATAQAMARLDVFAALAEAAMRGNYTRPVLNQDTTLHITGGRHPVVEHMLEEQFVSNDTYIDTNKQQILLITGPNMAGKSTVLRQVALIVLLAQIGSFVPADSATIGLVDRIFTRIGAQDDIATGQSTFMVEMTETAALLMQSSPKSLIILDEVGRGTSTYDGMAIARAVVEYIHNEPRLKCRTLFATHYHELTDLQDILPGVKNYHMAAVEQEGHVVFLYQLREGCADRSYGIHVAELAGIPRSVIRRANELLAELEHGTTNGTKKQSIAGESKHQSSDADDADDADTSSTASNHDSQLSLFDVAPHPVVEYLKRLNVNELTPIEALTKLYELQKIAQTPI